jgi:hypothetical protein
MAFFIVRTSGYPQNSRALFRKHCGTGLTLIALKLSLTDPYFTEVDPVNLPEPV